MPPACRAGQFVLPPFTKVKWASRAMAVQAAAAAGSRTVVVRGNDIASGAAGCEDAARCELRTIRARNWRSGRFMVRSDTGARARQLDSRSSRV